jgi:hypothetical protein
MGQLGCAKLSELGPHLFEHPALMRSGSRQHA